MGNLIVISCPVCRRLRLAFRRAWLRMRIASAERDVEWLQEQMKQDPLLLKSLRADVGRFQAALRGLERSR